MMDKDLLRRWSLSRSFIIFFAPARAPFFPARFLSFTIWIQRKFYEAVRIVNMLSSSLSRQKQLAKPKKMFKYTTIRYAMQWQQQHNTIYKKKQTCANKNKRFFVVVVIVGFCCCCLSLHFIVCLARPLCTSHSFSLSHSVYLSHLKTNLKCNVMSIKLRSKCEFLIQFITVNIALCVVAAAVCSCCVHLCLFSAWLLSLFRTNVLWTLSLVSPIENENERRAILSHDDKNWNRSQVNSSSYDNDDKKD